MLVKDYKIDEALDAVKVMTIEDYEKIEKIISKDGYSHGEIKIPYLIIDSYKSKVLNEHLVLITYLDIDEYMTDVSKCNLMFLRDDKRNVRIYPHVGEKMVSYLRDSIMFDNYMSTIKAKLTVRDKKRLIYQNIIHNRNLIDSIENRLEYEKSLIEAIDNKPAIGEFYKKYAKETEGIKF